MSWFPSQLLAETLPKACPPLPQTANTCCIWAATLHRPCANRHMRRLMRVSSANTWIQRTYLQQRRGEPSDYFYDLCKDAGINKGCTHTCTPTHAQTHARGASLLETFVAFFMIPPLQRKWFSISSEPTLKEASGFSSNDKSNLIKGGRFRSQAAAWRVCAAARSQTFHWPCFGCAVLSRFGNWWPADKNQFQSGWVGTK